MPAKLLISPLVGEMAGRPEGGAKDHDAPWLWTLLALAAVAVVFAAPTPALAHASERGHVLLLPTGYYTAGGAWAVAASFLALALLPSGWLDRIARQRIRVAEIPDWPRTATSLASFAILAILVAAGWLGSRDPLSNPLPLTVWTLVWVGLTLVQGLFGNLWHWLDPWYAPVRLATAAGIRPLLRLPNRLGFWPGVLSLFAFAWFELVYPAPDDPARLATVVSAYWLATFVAMLVFGHEDWSKRGEFLSIFFGFASRFGVFSSSLSARRNNEVSLCWPGAKLAAAEALPLGGVLFLLLALSSVSFDGLSKTFFWLGLNGVNPLELPGRTALIGVHSFGLVAMFCLLSGVYLLAVWLGERLAGSESDFRGAAGLLIWSIVPIALAYHFSHYLTALLVNGQYALVALSDPFGLGWNLFGTANLPVEAGILMGSGGAWLLWNLQAAAIVAGHVLAVLVAHGLAHRLHPQPERAALSQLPLTALMVGYTVFGLWLLSTPTAA